MWFGLLTQWILLFPSLRGELAWELEWGLILLDLTILILSVILSLYCSCTFRMKKNQFKNTVGTIYSL